MLGALLAVVVSAAPVEPAKDDQKPRMQAAVAAVVTLQPYLLRPSAFRAKENAAKIAPAIDALVGLRHGFFTGPTGALPADDVALLFARQAEAAKREFGSPDVDPARTRLQGLTGMCLACHLRTPTDADFKAGLPLVDALKPTSLERAQLYATTRHFDEALKVWKTALVAPAANDVEGFDQAQALRVALAVAVRGKDDPQITIALLEQQRGRAGLPGFVARWVDGWLAQARAWKDERFNLATASPDALIQLARRLVEQSNALRMTGSADDQLITLSRASAALDELLRRAPQGPYRAEALFLSGVAAATTSEPALWQLEALFFEACVRENPSTPIARACVERLRERTFFAYQRRQDVAADALTLLGQLTALAK